MCNCVSMSSSAADLGHDLLRSVREIVGRDHSKSGTAQNLLAELDIGAFEPYDQRYRQVHFTDRGDDAFGDDVATHDAAEDVDQNAFHIRTTQDDLEGFGNLLLRCAAADIEEVGRFLTIELDDVHGCHGKAGAVD